MSEEYLRFVIQYYQEAKKKGRIKSPAGAMYKALMTDQLKAEFVVWQADQPVYHAPKPVVKPQPIEIIQIELLNEQFLTLQSKGLASHETFEAYLDWMLQQQEYDMDVVDGKEVLVYTPVA
ncbi:hypothetical protein [Spirosoma sp. KNUC1025]|uniref:hypothetical protein n=1 Tax=Spirosoma sp. KNUC1025 TaxID=2894082 RepID=UPI001E459F0C|nr:hypothetical protein [Spirosoma sp. KNUC1025]UFH57914.1 hypothetical protein LN737_31650 [Spirosoma sp. KNUC1025]